MIKTVVFDIGNVLLRWDPRNLYNKLFDDSREMESFLHEVCTETWNLRQDAGYPWDKATAELVTAHPRYETEIRAFRGRWHEMLVGQIDANVALLEGFRRSGVPNYAITNFAADTFKESQQRFPVLRGFDGIICSGDEGICKPDPKIFHLLLERYKLDPGTCVFIDDNAANIRAANTIGFRTIHYGLGVDAAGAFRQFGLPVD